MANGDNMSFGGRLDDTVLTTFFFQKLTDTLLGFSAGLSLGKAEISVAGDIGAPDFRIFLLHFLVGHIVGTTGIDLVQALINDRRKSQALGQRLYRLAGALVAADIQGSNRLAARFVASSSACKRPVALIG